jgi:hypothetical protein
MQDILQYTDFGLCSKVDTLAPEQLFAIETLLAKLPHKLLTRVTDINEDEIVVRTQLFDNMFIIVYNREVTNEYKWTISSSKQAPTCATTYEEVELFINMYNKYF